MRRLALVTLGTFVIALAAQAQAPLPAKMKGRYFNPISNHGDIVEVELVAMESPTKAQIKVVWWPYCKKAATTAEFVNGWWEFTARECRTGSGDSEIPAKVKPVDGKNRLEGTYGPEQGRTLYLEW